jgi:hypothetical protein
MQSNVVLLEQLINNLLDGLSGRIIWGIVQIILTILGDIGKFHYRSNRYDEVDA